MQIDKVMGHILPMQDSGHCKYADGTILAACRNSQPQGGTLQRGQRQQHCDCVFLSMHKTLNFLGVGVCAA